MTDMFTIIITALTSVGLLGFVEFLIKRKDSKEDQIKALCEELKSFRQEVQVWHKENQTGILKLQLTALIQNDPKNIDTILYVAKRYFKELGGDGEMHAIFYKWADEQNVDVSWFKS